MEDHAHHTMIDGEHSPREVAKFVAVIMATLFVSVVLTALFGAGDFLRFFMGVFFVVFASFKFAGYGMFKEMFAGYDIIAKRSKVYAAAYPFIELALGIAYLINLFPLGLNVVTFIIMAVSSVGVFQEIRRRSGIHCACLGNVIKLPLSTVSLVENVGMGLMALLMLVL